MTKKYLEKRKRKKEKRLSKGGYISELMAVTPLMRKKIAQNRTIFNSEKLLDEKEVIQLKTSNQKNKYLKVDTLKYVENDSDEISYRKIDEEFIWNEIVRNSKSGKVDFEVVSEEIAKKYLESGEKYIDVEFSTYEKVN